MLILPHKNTISSKKTEDDNFAENYRIDKMEFAL